MSKLSPEATMAFLAVACGITGSQALLPNGRRLDSSEETQTWDTSNNEGNSPVRSSQTAKSTQTNIKQPSQRNFHRTTNKVPS